MARHAKVAASPSHASTRAAMRCHSTSRWHRLSCSSAPSADVTLPQVKRSSRMDTGRAGRTCRRSERAIRRCRRLLCPPMQPTTAPQMLPTRSRLVPPCGHASACNTDAQSAPPHHPPSCVSRGPRTDNGFDYATRPFRVLGTGNVTGVSISPSRSQIVKQLHCALSLRCCCVVGDDLAAAAAAGEGPQSVGGSWAT